jgi:hypothetical protein
VEDVAWPVDDMKTMVAFLFRGDSDGLPVKGKEKRGKSRWYLGEGPQCRRRKAVETPTRQHIDAGDLACGGVMEDLVRIQYLRPENGRALQCITSL